jgi:serine/threonine protein phosphatase PrpC
VDTFGVTVQDGDILALCTHHLTEYVQEEELSRMIRPERLQQSVQNVIQEARKRIVAGKDGDEYSAFCNLTLMAVSISLPQDED